MFEITQQIQDKFEKLKSYRSKILGLENQFDESPLKKLQEQNQIYEETQHKKPIEMSDAKYDLLMNGPNLKKIEETPKSVKSENIDKNIDFQFLKEMREKYGK